MDKKLLLKIYMNSVIDPIVEEVNKTYYRINKKINFNRKYDIEYLNILLDSLLERYVFLEKLYNQEIDSVK